MSPSPAALDRLPDPLPLVGRRQELAHLEALLEDRKQPPTIVFLRGEGGVGKSRLALEFADRAERRSWRIAKGRAYPTETGSPYALFSDAWLPLLKGMDPATLTKLTRGGEAELQQLFPALGAPRRDDDPIGSGDPDELRTRLMWNFAEFVKLYAARQPLLCVFEDLQWADDSSLHLIHFLARQLVGHPVLIVCTYNDQERDGRPGLIQAERSLSSLSLVSVLRLEPLSLDQVTELIALSFGMSGDAVREFAAVLFGWTRGNAFFLEEIIRSLVETGRIRHESGTWVGWGARAFGMPGSIRDAVIGRVRGFSAAAQTVADLTAIVGTRTSLSLLQSISGLDVGDLLQAVEELCAKGTLVESAEADEVVYRFAHPLVRQILYDELGLARTRLRHGQVAEAMEAYYGSRAIDHADELAFHFSRAEGSQVGGKARRYLVAAGRRALDRRADREAIDYLRQALERGAAAENGEGERPGLELATLLARAHTHVGEFDEAARLWSTALAAVPSARREHSGLRRALGMTHFWRGDHAAAFRHLDAGLASAEGVGDQASLVRLLVAKAHCLHEQGRGTEALEALGPALPLAEATGDLSLLARVHRGLALLHLWIGPPQDAERHAERAIELATEVGDVSIEFWARWGLAVLSGMRGDTARMMDLVAQVKELAEKARSPVLALWTADMVIEFAFGRGDWQEGIAEGERAIELARSLNQRTILPRLLVWTSEFFTERGDLERAHELLREAIDVSGIEGSGQHNVHEAVPTYIGLAHYLLGIGDVQGAIEAAEKGLTIAEGSGYVLWAIHQLLPVLAEAYLRVDRIDDAQVAINELRAHAERIDHRLGMAWADAGDALVMWKRGDADGSVPLMQRSAEALERVPMVWHATRLRRELSARLWEVGRRDEAKQELDRVWHMCLKLEAHAELERARVNYRERGWNPPSRPRSEGPLGLTPEELEIAKLAAQGHSTKKVALARGSSERTVSTHLYNAYRKLGLGGPGARVRLGNLIREAGLLDD